MGSRLSLCVLLQLGCITIPACSSSFTPTPCTTDSDCADTSYVCEIRQSSPVCVLATDAPILIGQSAPYSGTNQALGIGMKLGAQLAIDEQNAKGGIRGRMIQLVARDDGYDPIQAEGNARTLVDAKVSAAAPLCPNTANPVSNGAVPPALIPVSTTAIERGPNAVLALLGDVGTPTAVRAAPVAIESGTLFFGAFTGAGTLLRDMSSGPCAKYIFNVRASYAQEADATLQYFLHKGVADYRDLVSFDQNDTFGQAGYDGLKAAYTNNVGAFPGTADPTNPIQRFRYTRNDDTSVPAQAAAAETYLYNRLLAAAPGAKVQIGIMMTDTYGAGASFIQALRDWQNANDSQQTMQDKANRLVLHFSNVSFVGPNALSDTLKGYGNYTMPLGGQVPYTNEVVVSQVVPNYHDDLSDVVQDYNKLIMTAGEQPGFTSLEGYIATRVFIGGLLNNQGPFTPDALVTAFESLPDLGLGIGASAGFSPTNHQYSSSVWGTNIQTDGTFKNLYFWTSGHPIQFFQ